MQALAYKEDRKAKDAKQGGPHKIRYFATRHKIFFMQWLQQVNYAGNRINIEVISNSL